MESLGRFVGIAEHMGSAMTFKILVSERMIIHRAIVSSAASEGAHNNKRANLNTHGSIVEKDMKAC